MKKIFVQILALSTLLPCLLTARPAGATDYTLTLLAQGSGTVTPDNTNSTHPANVKITVTATPNAGWYFSSWSGNAAGSVNPLLVTMTSDLVITGNFLAYPTYALALVTNGQGSIALSPAGGAYYSNTTVTATATPAAGWVFAGWSGAAASASNSVAFALNTNGVLTGTFAQLPAFDAQPVSLSDYIGSTVGFSAHAVGTAPLTYQWFFSGGALNNANNSTLSLTNVGTGQAGNYWVVATNEYGSATSQVASLTLTNHVGPTNVVSSLDETSLRAAIAAGGWVGIQFNGPLTLANTITITNNVVLDGGNYSSTLSGGNAVRLFYVTTGASLTITNLTLANGNCQVTTGAPGTPADAGAIYNDGGTVTLVGCTLTNNMAQAIFLAGLARGGAIYNNGGTVSIYQSVLISNSVSGGGGNASESQYGSVGSGLGGAIYNTNGTMTLLGCAVNANISQGNCASFGTALTMGGAVFQASGSMSIENSGFASNQALGGSGNGSPAPPASPAYGGALAFTGGSVVINHCQLASNQAIAGNAGFDGIGAPAFGGAVYSSAVLDIVDSSISGNRALAGDSVHYQTGSVDGFGGGIFNAGIAMLNRCLICSNYVQGGQAASSMGEASTGFRGLGGGLFNASQLAATNCTIALNFAVGGPGSYSLLPATSGNAFGGGVFNNASAVFMALNDTIASNQCLSPSGFQLLSGLAAGGQLANSNGVSHLHNSLIAYSGSSSTAYGPIIDDGYNICDDASASLDSGSSYNNTDPGLAPLGDYGGPTWCMALLASSPAIDGADPADFPATDQRGYGRPADGYADMGAYEYGAVPVPITPVPSLNLSLSKTNLVFAYTAYSNYTYRLQFSTNLLTWSDFATNGPSATQTNLTQSLSKPGYDRCYFRLLQQ